MSDDPERRFMDQLAAYVLIVLMGAFGFWTIHQTQEDICETAQENREVSRNIVIAVSRLGADLRLQGKPISQATPEERKALTILSRFRAEQMARLNKKDVCADE